MGNASCTWRGKRISSPRARAQTLFRDCHLHGLECPNGRITGPANPGAYGSRGTAMADTQLQKLTVSENGSAGTSVEDWKKAFLWNLYYVLGRFPETASL